MDFHEIQDAGASIIECTSGITDARDSMDLAYACGDVDTDLLLIQARALPSEFFELRSGFAGDFVQRLVNSRLRTAAVFEPDDRYPDRFREFLQEARRHPQFRAFDSRSEALRWLLASAEPPGA